MPIRPCLTGWDARIVGRADRSSLFWESLCKDNRLRDRRCFIVFIDMRPWRERCGVASWAAAVALWSLLVAVIPARADQEASNVAHVDASSYGRCYAKSVPEEYYGGKGTTHIFRVGKEQDVPLHSFDWFSQRVYIVCNVSDNKTPVGVSVVRFGPWARGHAASSEHLALGFYFKGELLKEYSTLDIAGAPDNVSQSVSHYTVIEEVLGYERQDGNGYLFRVKTHDGRMLAFDPATGELKTPERVGSSSVR